MSVLHPISKNTTTILDMMTMTPFLTSARRLLHYGVDAGDTEVVTKSNFTGEYVCPLIKVRNGFPIGGKLVYGLYVSIHQYFLQIMTEHVKDMRAGAKYYHSHSIPKRGIVTNELQELSTPA